MIWRGWVHLTIYTKRTFHWPSFMHLSWSYKQDDLIPTIWRLLQNIFPPWDANFAYTLENDAMQIEVVTVIQALLYLPISPGGKILA